MLLTLGLDIRPPKDHKCFGRLVWDDEYTEAEPWYNLLAFHGDKTLEQLHQNESTTRRFYCNLQDPDVNIRLNRHCVDFRSGSWGRIHPYFVDVMGEYMCVVDTDTGNFRG